MQSPRRPYQQGLLRFMGDVYTVFLGYTPSSTMRRLTGGQLEDIWSVPFIESANLETTQSILSYFLHGERICEGLWAAAAEKGLLLALLRRLEALLLTDG